MTGITIWSYKPKNGRTIHDGDTHFSGIGTTREEENIDNFFSAVAKYGHAITVPYDYYKPWNHNTIGCGVGHNDAQFCESRHSMAAYYENGEAYGGRWWENNSYVKRDYYNPQRRFNIHVSIISSAYLLYGFNKYTTYLKSAEKKHDWDGMRIYSKMLSHYAHEIRRRQQNGEW